MIATRNNSSRVESALADGGLQVFAYDPTDPSRTGRVCEAPSIAVALEKELATGRPIAFIPLNALFSPVQAAEFVNGPLTSIHQAIAVGQLPAEGSQVRFGDLLSFRDKLRAARRQAIEELVHWEESCDPPLRLSSSPR